MVTVNIIFFLHFLDQQTVTDDVCPMSVSIHE